MTVDLKKLIPTYTARRGRFEVVDVPPLDYLMVDGHGDPNMSQAYVDAVASLYPLAYRLKSLLRDALGVDHVVMPLEALWWADDMAAFTSARDKSRWDWTLMIAVPDAVTPDHVEAARAAAARGTHGPRTGDVRLERLHEGLCVQTLHVGPYDAEGPVLAELHERVVPGEGLRMTGRHHEIYLGDPRRTAPERLRTILRQPVERVAG
ncbi:GyrI-like domain-containing protein [Cellulomonas sp. 179-A 9B4 NHS]|uniref:GyrI-like domain-containing protein n=1 Tax=Cellulomonas sp. 179-A 9B4 NHS TaxID=3142379 RepID=UPI0039A3DEFD